MKDLKQITVIGLGLLGGSVSMTVLRNFSNVKAVGYAHRESTAQKAKKLQIATEVTSDICKSVSNSDIVILATPISTFNDIFKQIAGNLKKGCIITDVGSTKVSPHKWAQKNLPSHVYYVGSHPIAGSEQRGIEYARDDLFDNASCIITKTKNTNPNAVILLEKFWSRMGCYVKILTPAEHDRIFASVSHVPHLTAAALLNANPDELLRFAGKGFFDTSRVASGPANIWADIFITNSRNCCESIDKLIDELLKLKSAINSKDKKQIEKLLEQARTKRAEMINYKINTEEVIS
ncbi:MAG: prephenate dehydrogenase [Planctomycetes bacterium]|nr:prephenate dehydrogenase [Planctomycetota bacterium]MBL7106234.1 prephenate dehydrogenase [Phycisphaerae bacterium]